jgi:outer membrane protein TolC
LARINEDVSIGQYEERIRNLVRDVEFAYWDLYAAYWNVDTARMARDSAAAAHKVALAIREGGASFTAEAQAKYTVHGFQAQLVHIETGCNF